MIDRVREVSDQHTSSISSYDAYGDIPYSQQRIEKNSTTVQTLEMEQLNNYPDPDKIPLQSSQRTRTSTRNLLHTWKWELCIWLLGTAGLVANVVLLIRFNGVEQHKWNSNIQITAFVAALSQLSQSALLVPVGASIGQSKWGWLRTARKAIDVDRFDLASRGPDGSLRLLWHLKLQPHLVSLGALSTLLMLAFPTFVQQSVAVTTQDIVVPDEGLTYLQRATMSRKYLNPFGIPDYTPAPDYTKVNSDPMGPQPETTAISQGILGTFVNPANISGNCTTGRCSWEPYQTLSICASTDDASASLVPGRLTKGGKSLPPTVQGPGNSSTYNETSTLYTYFDRPSIAPSDEILQNMTNGTDTSIPNIIDIYIVYHDHCKEYDAGPEANDDLWNAKYWTAIKTTFRPCIQTFNTTFEAYWNTKMSNLDHDPKWHTSTFWNDTEIEYCTSDGLKDEFCMSGRVMQQLGGSLNTYYNMSNNNLFSPGATWVTYLYNDLFKEYSYCNRQALSNVDRRVQNIAASLSIEMRRTNESTSVIGTAWRTGTC